MDPDNLLYHKEHTWAKIEEGKATIGITDYAQQSLGDIVYLELPEMESDIAAGEKFGVIESTKATADAISPVSGKVIAVNEELTDSPEVINEEPYDKGWIAVVELSGEPSGLMEVGDYTKYVEEESK